MSKADGHFFLHGADTSWSVRRYVKDLARAWYGRRAQTMLGCSAHLPTGLTSRCLRAFTSTGTCSELFMASQTWLECRSSPLPSLPQPVTDGYLGCPERCALVVHFGHWLHGAFFISRLPSPTHSQTPCLVSKDYCPKEPLALEALSQSWLLREPRLRPDSPLHPGEFPRG